MILTFLIISILINILVIYLFINSQKKLEISEEGNEFFIKFFDNLKIIIHNSKKRIEDIDRSGHFNSDDEVGYYFTMIKDIQNNLDNIFEK